MNRSTVKYLVIVFTLCNLFGGANTAYSETYGVSLELLRYDRLPDLPGEVSSYDLDVLPSTTEKFLIVADIGRYAAAFPEGNVWVKGWGEAPFGQVVIKQPTIACSDYIATPDGKVSAIIPVHPGGLKGRQVYLFRDLSLTAVYDITAYPDAWLVNISNDGKIVCRVSAQSPQALFLLPGDKLDVRTFPGTFLNWDFARSRAIIRDERLLRVVTAAKTEVCSCKLPFVATGAWPFHDGTIMARSRGIGNNDGPAWRIVLDDHGKVKGEAIFGEWMLFPDYMTNEPMIEWQVPSLAPSPPIAVAQNGKRERRRAHSVFVSIEHGRLVTRSIDLHDGVRGPDAGIPASNAFHEYNCLDRYTRLYTLMSDPPVPGKENEDTDETVCLFNEHGQTIPLISSRDVAKLLSIPSARIYSMTISPDGERLALTVMPDGEGAYDRWWLVEYRIIHPHGALPRG